MVKSRSILLEKQNNTGHKLQEMMTDYPKTSLKLIRKKMILMTTMVMAVMETTMTMKVTITMMTKEVT